MASLDRKRGNGPATENKDCRELDDWGKFMKVNPHSSVITDLHLFANHNAFRGDTNLKKEAK